MLIVDFTDAFKHLVINPAERRFLAGQCKLDGEGGFFVYLVLLFGAIPGPLLWVRLAAWLMRASAATTPVDRLGLQCYVDDPFLVARGTKKGRTIEVGCFLLLWRALNCCLTWNKGALGQCIEWIGGSLRLNVVRSNENGDAVIVSIGEAKLIKVQKIATALQDESMVDRTRVKEFAGLCSWIGSIVPNVKPFTQMLRAAASAKPSVNESQHKMSSSRVRLPLQWLHAMARDRTIDAKQHSQKTIPRVG